MGHRRRRKGFRYRLCRFGLPRSLRSLRHARGHRLCLCVHFGQEGLPRTLDRCHAPILAQCHDHEVCRQSRSCHGEEVRRQFNTIPGLMEGTAKPEYKKCIEISTQASLAEMGPPGALVILTPLIIGTLFGVSCLAGVLVGALISGVQLAISASNTGGAWDNAKKYLEAGRTEHARMLGGKGTEAHKAAVIGDTVGDPLKDTSGPSLNILIKLMAVESLVFAPFFATHTRDGLIFQFFK